MWQALISPVSNVVGSYLKNKGEEKQAKHKAKMATIANDADWESKMADASANSWKDEFWTIVLSVPIFMLVLLLLYLLYKLLLRHYLIYLSGINICFL